MNHDQGPARNVSAQNPLSLCFAHMSILSARCESERAVHLVLCSEGGGFLGLVNRVAVTLVGGRARCRYSSYVTAVDAGAT